MFEKLSMVTRIILGRIIRIVVAIPFVRSSLERICGFVGIKGRPDVIRVFLEGLADASENERRPDLTEALSWGMSGR